MIELIHLEKKYENVTPLEDVNAVIKDGDVISVIGPSGTGKSTLIRCINMLEHTPIRVVVEYSAAQEHPESAPGHMW